MEVASFFLKGSFRELKASFPNLIVDLQNCIIELKEMVMAELHEYSAKGINKRIVESGLASCALVASIVLSKGYTALIGQTYLKQLAEYQYIIGPSTMAGLYALFYQIFSKYIWKLLPNIPNMEGTWLVCAQSENRPMLYGLGTVEQNWNGLSINIDYRVTLPSDSSQNVAIIPTVLTIDSIAASFDSFAGERAEMQIAYKINDAAHGYEYDGLAKLVLDKNSLNAPAGTAQVNGRYFTNRFDYQANTSGTRGAFVMQRVSKKMKDREAIKSNQKIFAILEQTLQAPKYNNLPLPQQAPSLNSGVNSTIRNDNSPSNDTNQGETQ